MKRGVTGRCQVTSYGGKKVQAFVPANLPPEPPSSLLGSSSKRSSRPQSRWEVWTALVVPSVAETGLEGAARETPRSCRRRANAPDLAPGRARPEASAILGIRRSSRRRLGGGKFSTAKKR